MAQIDNPNRTAGDGTLPQRHHIDQAEEKLRQSIKYWQDWEAGYKDLREALQSLGEHVSKATVEETASRYIGDPLNEKEIEILLADERNGTRTAQQIVGLLSRRIEYVQSNIRSLQNQSQVVNGIPTVSDQSRHDDVEDFPLMEIQEELDEDNNVISGSVIPASSAAPQIVEALRKAGLTGLPTTQRDDIVQHETKPTSEDHHSAGDSKISSPTLNQATASPPQHVRNQQPSPSTSESDGKGDSRKAGRRRKSVTFADGTKSEPPTSTGPRSARDVRAAKAANKARTIKAEVRGSIDALKKVHSAGFISDEVFDRFRQEYVERLQTMPSQEVKQPSLGNEAPSRQEIGSERKSSSTVDEFDPIVPAGESPEDAALRREMIRYNMSEVGAVVAEMSLDDDGRSDPSDSVDSHEDEHQGSSEEDEDGWGMSTRRAFSNDYVKQMQALQEKLNATSSEKNGSGTDIKTLLQAEDDLEIGAEGNPQKARPATANTEPARKAVRFAKALDIHEPPPSPKPTERREPRQVAPTQVHTDIIERPTPVEAPRGTDAWRAKKKRASRFSKSLSAERQAAAPAMQMSNGNQIKTPSLPDFTPPATPKVMPTGPPGRTHSPHVIERPYSDGSDREPVSEPDEFDAALLRRELTMDHQVRRNRMIQRQGGFLASEADEEEEEAEGPLVDENGKKISRFKAARLQASGR
ncbi:MAG: hypothetical protein Q9168_001271 [Polycauliona sp. 1 TL-2023]